MPGRSVASGMPEAGYLPIPAKLARAGVKDMVRISDARMSGTAYGSIVLHVTPDAASGGPLAKVRNGDRIRLSVKERRIDLLVAPDELARRTTAAAADARARLRPPLPPRDPAGRPRLRLRFPAQAPARGGAIVETSSKMVIGRTPPTNKASLRHWSGSRSRGALRRLDPFGRRSMAPEKECPPVKFGFCVMANIDEIGFFPHVEALGYDSVWVADSQMLFSDCYAVLALAARQTQPPAPRPGHRDLRHAHPAGAGRGDGDAQPPGARPRVPRHRHRQHRDAHAWASGRCGSPSSTTTCGCSRRCCAARPSTTRSTASPGRSGMLMHDNALHEPGAEDPALRLGVRAAGDGAGGRVRRRPGLRHPAARRAGGRGAGACRGRAPRAPAATSPASATAR